MAKRRTSGIQRRERASTEAMTRRIDDPAGLALPDWRLLAIGGVLVVGVLLIILVLLLGSGGTNPNAGVRQTDDGTTHINGGFCREDPSSCGLTANPYSSLPATSGPHWQSPTNWGVYTSPQAESQLIHNLEHGGIVIWYDAEAVDDAGVQELTSLVERQNAQGVGGRYKWILSPWGGADPLPSPVVATSWNWLLELDGVDTAAIEGFASEHYGIAPEPNGGPGPPG